MTRRAQVDRALQDVFSEPCLTARVHAHAREETLFPEPTSKLSGSTRHRLAASDMDSGVLQTSTSQLLIRAKTMASRMNNRLSIRVKPTLSSLFVDPDLHADVEGPSVPESRASAKFPNGISDTNDDGEVKNTATALKDSLRPTPESLEAGEVASRCSSVSTSHGLSDAVGSQLSEDTPPAVRVVGVDSSIVGPNSARADEDEDHAIHIVLPEDRPKRTRSLVDNVRGFFLLPRWSSSVSSLAMGSGSPLDALDYAAQPGKSAGADADSTSVVHHALGYRPHRVLTKFWKTASLRRRVRSEPDVPRTSQSVHAGMRLTIALEEDGHPLSPAISAEPLLQSRTSPAVTITRSSSSSSVMLLGRKRGPREEREIERRADGESCDEVSAQVRPPGLDPTGTQGDKLSVRRSLKHRLFLQNSSPLTPVSSE